MNSALHEKVLGEYQKKQQMHKAEYENKLNELYAQCPKVKAIDDEISFLAVKHAARIIKENISPQEAVEAVNAEKANLESMRRDLLGDREDITFKYDCDICKDTGSIDGKKCKCYMEIMQRLISEETNGAKNISIDFENETFENFSLSWYSKEISDPVINISPYDNMKSVYAECINMCRNFGKEAKNLYFYGASGTGKTFMASCIANRLIADGYTVVYQSAYKLFQFMEDYKFCRIERDNAEYDRIYNCDLLIIDDLGTEFSTAYTCSVLFDILNTRLLNKKSTIISSNLNLSNLEKKYTDRVQSRIIGNFEMLRFMGQDIRILKKQIRR